MPAETPYPFVKNLESLTKVASNLLQIPEFFWISPQLHIFYLSQDLFGIF